MTSLYRTATLVVVENETLVTFDRDLKRRPLGGRTPARIIASLK
ncbi:MAG TPA: hypothetical protein VFY40_26280 [Blastocatellia bacterium]|nr:hypothetical protein [Blastocatellia bacterium]